MLNYIIRRLLYAVPIILGVLVITFSLFRAVQNPQFIASQAVGEKAPQQAKEAFIEREGLNKAWPIQLGNFIWRTITLDFGSSWKQGRAVTDLFREGVKPTLLITIPGFIAGLLTALGFALFQVFVRNSPADRGLTVLCVALMSIPTVVYIICAQAVFSLMLNYAPASGFADGGFQFLRFIALPVFILAVINIGYDGRMFRAVFLEEIAQDYVRTAHAKGVAAAVVLRKHVLKNGLIGIITLVVGQLPKLIMGSLLIESFFGIPGMGQVLVQAIQLGDQPVVMASVFLGALLYVAALILTDILYAVADPRIRLS